MKFLGTHLGYAFQDVQLQKNVRGLLKHVAFLAAWDSVMSKLPARLEAEGIPYVVMEGDGAEAARMHGDGIPVVRGEVDDVETFRRLRADRARMVVLNRDDLLSTSMALTVRKIAGHAQAHVIGSYEDLLIAEFSAHLTPLAGRSIAEARLREIAGVSVVGVWERGQMVTPRPDLILKPRSLPVVAGSAEAIERLNEYLYIYDTNWNPVVVIGGGKVGCAAALSLKEREIPVHMMDRDPTLVVHLKDLPDRLVIGDAADREAMESVGIREAPSVILTTNADATNIYRAAYCRRVNPEAHIVSRITHDRNLAAIQRAGADLTLSYARLGVETGGTLITDAGPGTRLERDSTLLAIGSAERVEAFRAAYR